jgi:MarR family 2-MHQ and catechol resistance regulon transcriptional repressor
MPTHYPGTQKERLALTTFIKLTRAVDSLTSRLDERRTQGHLSGTQFGVMEVLLHLGPMCQAELAGKLLKSGGNITMVVDNLEKLGYVTRERDERDRRRYLVTLTDKGRAYIESIFPTHVAAIVMEMDTLTPAEQETLGKLCRKLGKGTKSV